MVLGTTPVVSGIKAALGEILQDSERRGKQSLVGVFTSAPRDDWHQAYTSFAQKNRDSLDAIESSLFVLCLDDTLDSLKDMSSLSKCGLNTLHGCGSRVNGFNRWHDKALQFLIARSGEVGITNEHSFAEAVIIKTCASQAAKLSICLAFFRSPLWLWQITSYDA